MNYVEAEANSIDEAIGQALAQLGVTRDKVDIDIISNATRGLFGFGGRRAKVRATLRMPLDLTPAPNEEPTRAPKRPQPMPAERTDASRRPDPPGPSGPVDEQAVARARTMLQELVRLMGSDAEVAAVTNDSDGPRLIINGDASGILIGRRGQTLDALEYLANRIVAREEDHHWRLSVDSQSYRERRRQALEQLASRLAERVRRRNKTVTLNPMSPRDRRVVHLALQSDRSVTTRSAGKGYFRKLLIIPEGSRGDQRGERPPRRPSRERS